ncbi:MAG TPA: right-handed parallel beta-helix repeat-containing protein [Ktedonobacterales bacterium]|nr:right-handed parallel beta-helix repeat-containing protein [Ktedonobacterales bacterium]
MTTARSSGPDRRAFAVRALASLIAALALVIAVPVPASRAQSLHRTSDSLCPPGAALRSTQSGVPSAQFSGIIHVPGDRPSIQAAVDAAQPGELILIAPGVYHEAVKVCTADLTIRGQDRNATVLDGQSRLTNGFTVLADNVIIENMTAHHYVGNGFYWTNQTGYRGSYLTAYDNGDYGIYAFGSTHGEFDRSYASGSPDSGFYIGQCFPCDAIINQVRSEWNGLGYSGTNAGGNLVIENSEWNLNSAGIVPNTLDSEKGAPERGATLIGNYVHDNGNDRAPYNLWSHIPLGTGILIAGGDMNYVAGNRVINNPEYGILVLGNIDQQMWIASGNVVEHNVVHGSGLADLALGSPSGANNCFSDNQAETTLPPLLEATHACGSPFSLAGGGDFSITLRLFASDVNAGLSTPGPSYHPPDFRLAPAPPQQPNMPDVNAPPAPIFVDPMPAVATSANGYPPAANAFTRGGPAMLQPLGFTAYSIVQILLSLYGNLLLFALYSAWLAVAFVELSQRKDLGTGGRLLWGVVTLGIPIVGPILYYFASRSQLSRRFRLGLVIGAPVLCLAVTVLLLVVASYTLL